MRLPASFLALAATLLLADAQNTGPSCSDRMDIVLVIDGSESIGTDNFQKVRSATEAFARQAFNRIQNLRLGIVVYGTSVEQSIYPSSTREEVFQTLENLAYPVNGGTNTDLGIDTARALLNTTSNIRAMVVLTDGLSRFPEDTENSANAAKSEGITVYSVGVTLDSILFPQSVITSYTLELDRIATSPQNRLSIDNFDQLSILASGLLNQVCVTQLTVTSGLVDQTIFVGDTLTLVARMSESGLQDILWFKGNTRLPSDPRITYSSSGFEHRLTITNAQQSDSGTYSLTINGVSTDGQVTVQGNSNPGSTAVCRENIDVFLAIDGSNSINPDPFEFELLPAVVSFVDEMFNRTQNGLRMGYVLYSRIINSEVNLSRSDAFIRSSLLGETYPNEVTNTHLALNRIKDLFDAQSTDSAKVVMVITDGASDDLAATAQAALNLKAAGVQIIAVGVGDLINQEELRGLASSSDMVILVENFQSLATQLLNITSQCNGVFSPWTEQSRTPCTVPCGGGNQIVTRTRTCSGGSCVGPTSETFSVNCNTATCTLLQRFVDIDVFEGDTFELVAVFGEANIPGATWTKGGRAIFNGGRFSTSGTGFDQTLRVTSTQMTDAGQYVLSVGGVTTFATVTVRQRQGVFTTWTEVSRSACSAPCNGGTQTVFRTRTCQSGTCSGPTSQTTTENCNTAPCTLLQRLINIQVTVGDTFSLTAVFREANIPGARWTKGGVVVNSNGRFSITGTGTDQTLRVTNSQLDDAGQYTLSVGGVTTLATVTVVPRNTPRAVCQGSLDIFLAIDGSNSINPDPFEFDLLPALVSFIEEMFTRTTDLRMGYVLYSTILRGELDLTADSSLLSQSVAGLQYPNGVTNTHLALNRIDTLFTASNRDAAKVVIIITDGASDDRNLAAAAATTLKNKDVQVMAVGVGDLIDQQELRNLASSPDMVVLVSNFAQLASQLTNISNQCSGVAVWSEWISQPLVGTPCTRSCGGGTQQRTYVRRCNSTAFTNTCPGSSRDVRNEVCNTQGCPTFRWLDWVESRTECSASCGGGLLTITRTRTCEDPTNSCAGSSSETFQVACNTDVCTAAFGQWGLWSVWTPGCPLCGSNPNINQQRTRDCVKASPTDLDCPGNAVDNRVFTCTLIPCQATWNNWGQWSNPGCPTCGLSITRTVTRTRTCNQVAGQAFCSGSSTDSDIRTCSIPNCRGTWAAWASWATPNCPTCGPVGTQRQVFRNRICNKVLTTYDNCIGSGSDSRFDTCSIPVCTATWNNWGQWSNPGCPTCGLSITRTVTRTRTCNQVAGQAFCSGSSTDSDIRTCNILNCRGTWAAWASWATPNCPTCGPVGTQRQVFRNRICNKLLTTYDDCIGSGSDSRFDTCSIPLCTASWNNWGQWSNPGCPTCGLSITRTVTRTRTCNQVAGQAFCSGSSTDSDIRTCNILNCRGTWAAWASWATPNCPACGPVGTQRQVTRNRVCNKVLTTYDDCFGSGSDSRFDTCSIPLCTASWNNWGQWSNPGCPTCGLSITRTVTRTRTCNQVAGQAFCSGSSTDSDIRTCNILNCRGTWAAWASWATPNCPTCGPVGTQRQVTRNRVCNKVLTTYDDCFGSGSDTRLDTCSIPLCTASWNNWGQWSNPGCPTCGLSITRTVTRTRTCNQVAGQAFCSGSSTDSDIRTCNILNCRGTWAAWASWATPNCPTCGPVGTQRQVTRNRICNKLLTTYDNCIGSGSDSRSDTCSIPLCTASWNNWGQWSNPGCPTCGLSITRTVTRTRTCNQVAGQAFCSGSSTDSDIRTCNILNCRGTWAAWASWATPNCPTCGPVGTQRQVTRNRVCNKLLTTYDNCIGSGSDSRSDTCSIPLCTATWNTWGSWVDPGCPTCGLSITRTASRTRTCNQLSGQTFCSGSSFGTEVRTCTIPNCIGTWGTWTSWTQPNCPSCGPSGTQRSVSRSRICTKAQPTDADCPGLNTQSRVDACSIPICTATWNTWGSWVDPGCPTCGLSITRTAIRTRTCNQLAGQQSCSGSSFGTEVRTCTIPNCIGVWTQWANWVVTGCPTCSPSGQTNTGTFTRVRTCNKAITTYADCPGSTTETKTDTCNVATCRVGTWTAWTAWSVGNCSSCGTNVTTQQTRTRTCFKTNTADTDCPGTTIETRTAVCQISACQATWNTWGSWVDPGCPTCGLSITRTASRTRTCNQLSGQTFCSGSSFGTEVRTCNIPNCIGTWAAWASWATPNCPTCGPVGTQRQVTRNRVCNKVLTSYADCIGSGSDSRFDTCSIPLCTASWNNWGQWSNPGCPTCGLSITRTVTRTRTCNQVAGQAFCSGSSTDSDIRTCSIPNCRGTWAAWGSWATPNCPTCGPVGTQRQVTRNRVCNKLLTTYDNCIGSGSDSRFDTCSIPVCTATWNNWGQWSNPGCPTCGLSITRTVTRTRTCNQVAGQAFCSGSSTDSVIRTCSIPNCRGTWAAWASWATPNCPTCGPVGTQRQVFRNRVCNKVLTTYDNCIGSGSDSRFDTCSIPVCTASWNNWGQWSNPGCPTCGLSITRTVTRTRTCNQVAGQAFCSGSSTDSDIRTCSIPNCRGTWAAWASWATPNCPTCGPVGTQRQVFRNRVCNKLLTTYDTCIGSGSDSRFDTCSIPLCTASWNNWGQWSNPGCPTCGLSITRTVTRTRTCNQVAGQAFCSGSSTDSDIRTCNILNCRGTWSAWASWNQPSCPSCGPPSTVRRVSRTRLCNKDLSTHSNCAGNNVEYRNDACNIANCTVTPGLCASVMNVSGVGYRYHPTDCDKYVQCYFNPNGEVSAVYRTCPFGHYWSQATMRCDHSWKVTCPHEKCNNTCVTTYNMEGSCRAYWSCDHGRSQAECCAVGFRYVAGRGCFPDLYCRDACPTPCTSADICDKAPGWDKPENYKLNVGFLGWMDSGCIPGSYFDILECGCNVRKNDTCNPEFSLTFNNQNAIAAAKGDWLTLDTVNITNGVAAFTGLGKLVADVKLPDAGVGCPVVLRFRYRENGSGGRQVLASSSDCRHGNTMIIAIHNNTLVFELTSWYGTLLSMPISTMGLAPSQWKDVTFMYNGKVLTGVIQQDNYKVMGQLFAPKVDLVACGLTFGSDGSVLTAFDGQLDEINLYKCDPGNLY